ncbi:MAG: DUF3109 family protein [Saprospiraceae bacterium]|nr:DUF3109 family protein [Saprospiraceae bacterium]MDW8484578.1 DUF3109 family protein [Saprospiraceae bacterium]
MLWIEGKLISDSLVEEFFACELSACKGACCWEGDFGAPLEEAELAVLEAIYPQVAPFLSPAGVEAIERQGKYVRCEEDGSYGTPLIDGGPCAYLVLDENGIGQCGFERAYRAGATHFQKPISCHLYPVRVSHNAETGFEALNYHRWSICSAACQRGQAEKIPLYRFVREALVRKYGQEFYDALEGAAAFLLQQKVQQESQE